MKTSDLGLVLLVVLAAAVYFWGRKPAKVATRAQDLVGYTSISEDGIIELPGLRFALVLEVQAVPLYLRSAQEQAAIWTNFRSLLDSLTLPVTFLVQTRHLDLRGYLEELQAAAAAAATPQLSAYGQRLAAWFRGLAEERRVRELKHYIILRMDASDAGDFASGVPGGELVAGALKKAFPSGTPLSDADARDLARQELENQAAVIIGRLSAMGIRCVPAGAAAEEERRDRPLNRQEVLDMLYAYFNRDMADAITVRDADRLRAFLPTPFSETPARFEEVMAGGAFEEEEPARAAG